MKREYSIAILFLAFAALLRGTLPPFDPDGGLALKILGNRQPRQLAGQPAYRHGQSALLFFEEQGFTRKFRGVLHLENGFIEEVIILESSEGMDRRALEQPALLASYRGVPALPPIVVDAVAGATISCRALQNAVNSRLRAWQEEGHALR